MKGKSYYICLIRNCIKRGKKLPQTSLVYFQGEYNGCFCFWEMYVDPINNELRLAYKYNNLFDSSKVSFIRPLNLPEEELIMEILSYASPGGWHYLSADIEKI